MERGEAVWAFGRRGFGSLDRLGHGFDGEGDRSGGFSGLDVADQSSCFGRGGVCPDRSELFVEFVGDGFLVGEEMFVERDGGVGLGRRGALGESFDDLPDLLHARPWVQPFHEALPFVTSFVVFVFEDQSVEFGDSWVLGVSSTEGVSFGDEERSLGGHSGVELFHPAAGDVVFVGRQERFPESLLAFVGVVEEAGVER